MSGMTIAVGRVATADGSRGFQPTERVTQRNLRRVAMPESARGARIQWYSIGSIVATRRTESWGW